MFQVFCFRFVLMYRSSFELPSLNPLLTTATVRCTRSSAPMGFCSTNVATKCQCGNFLSQNMTFNAASVFHSGQLTVGDVKAAMTADGIEVRT